MMARKMPATASFDNGPLLASTTRRNTSASRSGRYAGPPLESPIACACTARSEMSLRSSRSSASMAARRRVSSSRSSRFSSFAIMSRRASRARSWPPCASLAVLFLGLDHALEPGELLAIAQVDERNALRRAPHFTNRFHGGADQYAAGRDQHNFVLRQDERRGDHLPVACALLDRDHALRAAPMARVLDDRGALAEPVLGGGQHRLLLVFGDQHADHPLALVELHAAHAVRDTAHRADVAFLEAHGLPARAEEHHVVLAIGERGADQEITVVEVDGDDA